MAVERIDISDTEDRLQAVLHEMRYSFALNRIPSDARVLEIGTGSGEMTKMLHAKCASYAGLEFDAEAVQMSLEKTKGSARILQGDAKAMPFERGQFTHIVCLEVLEHLGDWLAGVSEIHRCLEANGIAIISVPYRRIGGPSKTNQYHPYEPGESELFTAFKARFENVEMFSQYFEENLIEQFIRVLHLRRVLGTAAVYEKLSNGDPEVTHRLRLEPRARGMKIGVLLVATSPR